MFKTIVTLFALAFWAGAIITFLGGLYFCISNLINGRGFEQFLAVIAVILGIAVFFWVYNWVENIILCLFASGLVLGFVGGGLHEGPIIDPPPPPTSEPGPVEDFLVGMTSTYIEMDNTARAVEKGIRNSKW